MDRTSEHTPSPPVRPFWSEVEHFLQRSGLAMLGAGGGLFVAAVLAKTGIEVLAFPFLVLIVVLTGAVGGYLGVDLPPVSRRASRLARRDHTSSRLRRIERLGSLGTFFGALAAFVAVYTIVVDEGAQSAWMLVIGAIWLFGVSMQIVAGVAIRTGPAPLAVPRHGAVARRSGLVSGKLLELLGARLRDNAARGVQTPRAAGRSVRP